MYMSIPQLEQLLKDRQASALNSARTVGTNAGRKIIAPRGTRVRIPGF